MYLSLRERPAGVATAWRRDVVPAVSRVVVLLGLTSMLSDVSSEMVTATLPLYLTYELRFTALQFGLVDGLTQGVQAIFRVASGVLSDRRRHHKEVAQAGYALSTATRLGILAAGGSWIGSMSVVLVDRVGKGIRTSPRDAMISLNSHPRNLARSFGVHRAFDAAGALAGPLVAFAILGLVPGAYDAVFVVSFCFGLVGLAVLSLFVRRPAAADALAPRPSSAVRSVLAAASIRGLTVAGFILGATTVSDAFLYLAYRQDAQLSIQLFPLLFTGTALVALALAVPLGRVADHFGPGRTLVAGYVVLAAAYGSLLLPDAGSVSALTLVVLLGTFYAATDGVLMALTSQLVPAPARATGIAVVTTSLVIGRLVSSIAFGALWSLRGPQFALLAFTGAVLAAAGVAHRLLRVPPVAAA